MKPSALRIERLLAKVEAELARSARPRRYCFYEDEIAEAKAQGLPCFLVPRTLSQTETAPRRFKLGPLGNLNQVVKGLAKTLRAMADGSLDSQVGARICNGLGIMRACLETQKLEQLEVRMDEIADRVARDRTNAARERTSHA